MTNEELMNIPRILLMDILKLSKEVRSFINMRWINITIATQIRLMRKRRKWTQSELAEKAGLQTLTIVRIEKLYWGKTSPLVSTLIAIAAAFDVGLAVRFCAWSELVNQITSTPYVDNGLSPETFNIPTFTEELERPSTDGDKEQGK